MVKTKMRDKEVLKNAARKMGLEVKDKGVIREYGSGAKAVDLLVESPKGSTLGFSWDPKSGAFNVYAYGGLSGKSANRGLLNAVRTSYAREKVLSEARRRGFALYQEEKLKNGKIRLTLKRVA
jgi:hypothetical protein